MREWRISDVWRSRDTSGNPEGGGITCRRLLRGLSSMDDPKQRKALLVRRLRQAGFQWKGKYPSEEDILEVKNSNENRIEESEDLED